MFFSFVLIPFLCSAVAATAAAPLGCLLSWRRLIYFGEALAHSSLLGIALSLYLKFPFTLGIFLIAILLILLLYFFSNHHENANGILGSLSHISLALGMILISRMENFRGNMESYLFGDILATNSKDLFFILITSALTLFTIKKFWRAWILSSLNQNLAKIEIPKTEKYNFYFLVLLGFFIAIMVKYFGLLLVVSLLIIPAQTANRLAKSPEQSAFIAIFIAFISNLIGTAMAWILNIPVAASIVVCAGIFYFLSLIYDFYQQKV